MTILDEAIKTQRDSQQYLDDLGGNFKDRNRGKTVVVFPYLKRHEVVDNPAKLNEITSRPEYQKAVSFVFNL